MELAVRFGYGATVPWGGFGRPFYWQSRCNHISRNSLVQKAKGSVTPMRKQWPWAFKIGLLVILLVCSMAAQPGFTKGGKSTAHGYGKSAAGGAKQTPQGQTQGPAKADTTHTPVTREGDKPSDIDTRITVQPRRLGKSLSPNAGHVNPLSLANPNHQRTLSALPRAPYSPARNAIGLPISPRPSVGPGYGLPPNGLRSVHPLVSPAVPNNATGRVVAPHPTPSFDRPVGLSTGRDWRLAIKGRRRSDDRTRSLASTERRSGRFTRPIFRFAPHTIGCPHASEYCGPAGR